MSDAVCHCEEGIDLKRPLPSGIRGRGHHPRSSYSGLFGKHKMVFLIMFCSPLEIADIDHENDQVP